MGSDAWLFSRCDCVTESHTRLLLTLIPMHLEYRQVRLLCWRFSDCTTINRNQPKNVCSKINAHKKPYNCSILSPTGNNTQCQKGKNHIYHKARASQLIALMIKFFEHLVISLSLEGLWNIGLFNLFHFTLVSMYMPRDFFFYSSSVAFHEV